MGPILVVDCDVQSVDRLKAQLAELGHTVQTARDAPSAVLLADEKTEAIFIDLAMPTLDTHALSTRLRAQCAAPLVACVRTMRKVDTVFALRSHFADWLEKPVSREELKGVLSRLATDRTQPAHAAEAAPPAKSKSVDVLKDIVQMVRDGTISIPQMPQVVMRLRTLLQGADPDPGEVVRLVESDPGLASRITAMAASPAFGPGIDRPTVVSAVARLGIRQLQALVETSALTGMFPAPARDLAAKFRGKWNELVTSACLSREVAATVIGLESNEAYLLALFQDVGELFLLTVLSRFDGQAADSTPMVQAWHGQFGASLLAKWGMPTSFGLLARHHHDPDFDGIPDAAMRQRLHAINLANRLVRGAAAEPTAANSGPTADESLRALGLTPPQRERFEARVPDLQREVSALLG